MAITKICFTCGKEYKTVPSHATISKFCNKHCHMAYSRPTLEERYWAKVDKRGKDECWPWLGGRVGKTQYGKIGAGGVNGKWIRAHRLAYELEYGSIPDNMRVCHNCDNPACQNPKHLFLGTDADNVADKMRKGRHSRGIAPRGEESGMSRFTEQQILEIFSLKGKESLRTLAERYSTTKQYICCIQNKKTWIWLTKDL